MCPLWVGEGVLSLSYPLLHPGGDGGSTRTVERRKPTQPRGGGGGGGEIIDNGHAYEGALIRITPPVHTTYMYMYIHVHVYTCTYYIHVHVYTSVVSHTHFVHYLQLSLRGRKVSHSTCAQLCFNAQQHQYSQDVSNDSD